MNVLKSLNLFGFDRCWLTWNGYKKKASRSEFESKVRSIKRTLRTNSVFLVVLLLLGRKTKKKPLKLFKIHHWNDKEWELGHTISKMNQPCWSGFHQCVVTTFQSMVLFFRRGLMNLLRPSITTILQHRTNGWEAWRKGNDIFLEF